MSNDQESKLATRFGTARGGVGDEEAGLGMAWIFIVMSGAMLFAGLGPASPAVSRGIAVFVATLALFIGVAEALSRNRSCWLSFAIGILSVFVAVSR